MTVIVDYEMGNLGSIKNMLKRIGAKSRISRDPKVIASARRLILPGVGSFDDGMTSIGERGLLPVLENAVLDRKIPILGICLGMQLLTERSEEGKIPGLGWIEGETIRFHFSQAIGPLKVPHMGWNDLSEKKEDGLLEDMGEEPRFYFAHSFHIVCRNVEDIVGQTVYGYPFPSVIHKGNIMGTQFHPEKSHKYGMKILANFVKWS